MLINYWLSHSSSSACWWFPVITSLPYSQSPAVSLRRAHLWQLAIMWYFSNVSFYARYKNPPIYCPLLPVHIHKKKNERNPQKSLIHIQVNMTSLPVSWPPDLPGTAQHNCSWSWHTTKASIQLEHSEQSGVWKCRFQVFYVGDVRGDDPSCTPPQQMRFKQQSPLIAPQTASCWDLQSLLCWISEHLAHMLIQGALPDKYLILIKKMNKPDLRLYKSSPPATAIQSVYSSWVSVPYYGQF